MEDMRNLVPRQAPEGFLTWVSAICQDELDTHGFLYEQEWVEDWGLDVLMDEWASPRKRKMVRVQCSCCGYQDLYHYGRGLRGYGFILPESFTEMEGGQVYEDGDAILCPSCGCPVQIRRRAALRQKGYFVPSESRAMSAAVVGEDHLLALTGWVIQRRVSYGGGEWLEAVAAEAYVFSPTDCAQLMGWVNACSGNAGYFIQYTREWRQPREWRERWGEADEIFSLSEELLAESCLPHCKLDVYMEHRPGAYHFPVAWLRLYQAHPSVESVLVHGLPRVLDDLLYSQCRREDQWEKNKKGLPDLHELDWSQTRPAQMLHLNREELRLARDQDWGQLFWDLFRYSKAAGELLTGEDIVNAFYLGDDHVGQLVGRGPVAKSIRYLLQQCGQWEDAYVPEPEDEDPPADAECPDVQILTDYWDMAQRLGWDLSNDRVRFPHDLFAAHDEAAVQVSFLKEKGLAPSFRVRRMQLRKYVFAADGFFIRPAASQKELTDEGNALHHCVSSYGKNHASGKTAIFFIRRKRAPKESYYTLELDEKKLEVRQNRGLRNCPRTPEVQAFEELWIRWVRAGAPRDGSGKPVIDVGREVIVA